MKKDYKLLDIINYREKDPTKVLGKIKSTYPKLEILSIESSQFGMLSSIGDASKSLYTPLVVGFNISKLKTAKYTLLGKGITYDSGGYALKPSNACTCSMHFDKTGAILTAAYCAKYGTPGFIFLTPNLIGSNGTVNGHIVTAYDGTKVEISCTDAEGRLGLGDLAAYIKELNPKTHVVSVATLTGHACNVSGDNQFAILNSTNQKLIERSVKLFAKDKEFKIWPLPNVKAYDNSVKSKIIGCDLQNLNFRFSGAGTQTAYSFLKHFNSNQSLIDIAAMMVDGNGNGTGWGLDSIHKLLGGN